MLSRPPFSFSLDASEYTSHPVPSYPKDWEDLWAVWDMVTLSMIPKPDLLSKPIKLRNACIFYLGHIPCFLDMHLTRATEGVLTEPAEYPRIFERGIDPDVENPDHCHAHSEVPDTWPAVEDILRYQTRVRDRVRRQYDTDALRTNPLLARALWIGFEHEVLHLETLLYMLLQSDRTLPPPGQVKPDFQAMARQAEAQAVPNEWFTIPERALSLGMHDPESDACPDRFFGWDNEKPPRQVVVPSFVAKARPITNGEYAGYLEQASLHRLPASWVQDSSSNGLSTANVLSHPTANVARDGAMDGDVKSATSTFLQGKSVRTVYGLVPLVQALDWPVMASYDELTGFAKWLNGRIPSLEEVQSIYRYVDELKTKEPDKVLAKRIAAVNG